MLRISENLLKEIQDHGVASYPLEGCGFLLGRVIDGINIVEAVFPVENSWPIEAERRERFQITSADTMRAESAFEEQGLGIVGVFHSHPNEAPIASPRDRDWAALTTYSYLITEVSKGQLGTSRSWRLSEDRMEFYEEEIDLRCVETKPIDN